MDRSPHPIVTTHADRTRQAQQRQHVIGRRGLMKLAAGAGVATMGVAGRGLILPWFDFGRAAAAEELVEPEVRASRDGLLDTTLTCRVQSVPVAGQTAIMNVYEGSAPGPTLRVRPGDTLRVNLVNMLDDLPPGLPDNSPFLCSAHDHGRCRSRGRCATRTSTSTDCTSPPRTTRTTSSFASRLARASSTSTRSRPNHPAGLYWYHPHLHGRATNQVFGGMAGAIIVEGDIDALPGIAGVPERLLVLQATQLYPDGSVVNILDVPPAARACRRPICAWSTASSTRR